MTTNFERGSAKIYAFPARGRFVATSQCAEPKVEVTPASSRVAQAAVGSGWYHDEAIRNAERDRKS